MKQFLAAVLALAASVAPSLADGKMFRLEEIPPEIPYQRAIILFDEGIQTLLLQSKFTIPDGDARSPLGWVVPVPAAPEVASMPAGEASRLFLHLSLNTPTAVTRISQVLSQVLLIGIPLAIGCLSAVVLLLCALSLVIPIPRPTRENRAALALYSLWSMIICFVILPMGFSANSRSAGAVDVIEERRVGIYDVHVIRSDDTGELIAWLNRNHFQFGADDIAAFDSYISKEWCFVVAMINPDAGEDEWRVVSDGLAAPLILRFPHEAPVYPLALTGTGGFDTEILIYLASSTKMEAGDRLTMRFAGKMPERVFEILPWFTEPEGFFESGKMNFRYLTKFRDRLTPAMMSEDIVFTRAADEEPYRDRVIVW